MTQTGTVLRGTRLGALLWLCCFQYFAAEQLARTAWSPAYSMSRNYISDLGAVHCRALEVCSPLHAVMNGSFVLQGVLIFCGGLLVRRLFPRGVVTSIALAAITLSGVGLFLVGLAPEDVNPRLHYAAAAEHFLLDNLGMTLLGAALLRGVRTPRWAGAFTLASGVAGLAATCLLAQKISLGWGAGGMERVASYPFPLWLTLTGLLLFCKPRMLQWTAEAVPGQV